MFGIGALLFASFGAPADDAARPPRGMAVTAGLSAPVSAAPQRALDSDRDGIPDHEEDRDGNGVRTGNETDPHRADTDGDGTSDGIERRMGTDPNRADDVPRIPEPLNFDLMRELGAKRGELEVNALTTVRSGSTEWGANIAPEVEWAYARGHAVELELPFDPVHGRLSDVKLGSQGTFGIAMDRRLIHGWQALGTVGVAWRAISLHALYLAGFRLDRRWSGMVMVGPYVSVTVGGVASLGATLNVSGFYDVGPRLSVGVETNTTALPEGVTATVLPQAHVHLATRTRVLAGAGASKPMGDDPGAFFALRLVMDLH